MKGWYIPSKPSEIQLIPWLSPEATKYLETLLKPEFRVVEHGSGGSTLWFGKRVAQVVSYEKDEVWLEAVKARAGENVVLFHSTGCVPYEKPATCDLMLIDGEPVTERAGWIVAAQKIVKPGGYIVLDNANRPEYEKEREELRQHAELLKCVNSNVGSTVHLVTEFYRLKE